MTVQSFWVGWGDVTGLSCPSVMGLNDTLQMGQQLTGILLKKQSSAYTSNTTVIRLGLVMRLCYMLCACPRLPRDPFAAGSSRPVSSLDSPAALPPQQTGGQVAGTSGVAGVSVLLWSVTKEPHFLD